MAEIIRFTSWSNVAQNFFKSVKSSNFYAPSKCVKLPPFWFATEFNGAWVKGQMWRQFENTMILEFAYLLKGWASSLEKLPARCIVRGCSNSTSLQEVLRFMLYRSYLGMIVLKWRNEESVGSIWWKRNLQSARERSVLCISNQMILSTPGF